MRHCLFLLGCCLPAGALAAPPAMTSRYTSVDLHRCRTLEAEAATGSIRRRCPGFGAIPLYVSEDDERVDVDAGIDNGEWESLPAFNSLSGPVEWRLADGRPFAIIYRLRNASREQPPGSTLMVETIGRAGAPGCRIGMVDGALPDANARARALADGAARNPHCGT
jgi:hypothetical protein